MKKEKFQIIYMMVFIISSLGIVGNLERGIETSKYYWIIFGVSGMLTALKLMYWFKKNLKKLYK